MDKISGILITGITALALMSGAMIYDTWLSPEVLVCNDDASITNHSDRRLWLRVKAASADGKSIEAGSIESEAVEAGCWLPDEDGWYYYSMPLEFAQSTEPFAEGSFRLYVEAVDEAWLPLSPGCGMEAFDVFMKSVQPSEILYL